MITKRIKKALLGIGISLLIVLGFHYFLISNIKINSTIQVFIDFIIFFIILAIIFKISRVTKKKKAGMRYYFVFLIIIPILIAHYFLISNIKINSTIQVFIDLIIFLVILTILTQIKRIDEWIRK